jgi:hypothetical protein
MLLAFRSVQKHYNWSYGIQMTSLRFGLFSWAIAHASGQFSGTVKPNGFRKTHVVGISKCPKALQSELRNSNDVPTFRAVFVGHTLRANFRHLSKVSGTVKPDDFRKTHVVCIPKCPESLQSELRNLNDVPTFRAVLVGYSTRFGPIFRNR